ncbi:MAG: hypothetical protein IKD68_14870 [Solobacterium sp.]|nr:hypothetical protein [Solobacterium sp.]
MKEYFCVNASKYVSGKNFNIVRPASLNNPHDNALMFIMQNLLDQSDSFLKCKECLIFWPQEAEIPPEIAERHAVVPCVRPRTEYAMFFRDNGITYRPQPEEYEVVNGAMIAKTAVIGKDCTILPGAYIGGEVTMGDHCYIGYGTKLVGEVHLGNNVMIRENSLLGADGLTTSRDDEGIAITIPQFGSIVIEDDVQIGGLTVVARGAIDATVIGQGSKIDNHVFVSHNVKIGKHTFVGGGTIMFGSVTAGDRLLISGNTTLRNGIHLGSGSVIGAGAVVVKDVEENTVVKGNPAK